MEAKTYDPAAALTQGVADIRKAVRDANSPFEYIPCNNCGRLSSFHRYKDDPDNKNHKFYCDEKCAREDISCLRS